MLLNNKEKKMRNFTTFILIVSGMLVLSACSTASRLNDKVGDNDINRTPEPHRVCCIDPRTPDPLDDPQSILAKRSIYFVYDGFAVRDEFKPLIEAHSRYLLNHKAREIMIEGNTDERGSHEYNMALGQKRAESVRMLFTLYGVPDTQIQTTSAGEERPNAEGHNEESWAENRRVDIIYH